MNEKYYAIVNALIFNATIFAKGINFPNEPVQAPISGLVFLITGDAALTYKKLRKIKISAWNKFLIQTCDIYLVKQEMSHSSVITPEI